MLATRCSLNCSTDIELQVWRPLINTNTSERYYRKIGANRFTYRAELAQFVPQQQIEVIPGDVLGFQVFDTGETGHGQETDNNAGEKCVNNKYSDAEKGDSGVVILNFINNTVATNEEVWYARVRESIADPLSIGCTGILATYTDAAPVVLVSILRVNRTAHTSTHNYHTPSTVPPTPRILTKNEGSRTKMTIIVLAVLLTVSITIVAVIGICFGISRTKKTCTLTRPRQGDERNTPLNGEDVVKKNREAKRIQCVQVLGQQHTQEVQQSNAQATYLQLMPAGSSGFGSSVIGRPNSNADSITMKKNKAYGKVTFADSDGYENVYYDCNYTDYNYI